LCKGRHLRGIDIERADLEAPAITPRSSGGCVIRRVAERAAGPELVTPTFLARTLVYNGMLTMPWLWRFFPDLADARLANQRDDLLAAVGATIDAHGGVRQVHIASSLVTAVRA